MTQKQAYFQQDTRFRDTIRQKAEEKKSGVKTPLLVEKNPKKKLKVTLKTSVPARSPKFSSVRYLDG